MKILHILSQRQLTGAEAYAVTLATAQAQRGDAVYGVSDSFTLPFPGQTFLQPIGDRRWLQRLRNVCWLVRFLRRETIHVVHAHSRAAAWVAYIACKLTRTPLVATVHGLQAVHVSARWFRVLGRHIIAVCEALKAHLFQDLGYPARAIQVIPNGFPRHAWDIPPVSKSELYRVEPTVPVWLYAGRFTAQKGEVARLLLRALRLDFQLAGKLLVFLIGGTAIPNELIDQAEQLNRESGRTWVYLRSYEPELPRWMQAADMVIGAGRIATERLLLGKPVIAFGEKGYWGLVTPANWEEALKTNFGDVGGPPWPSECRLAADLCRWLEEPPPALPAALTDHLRCFFDIQRVEAAVRAVYEESRAASLPPMPILCYHRVVNQPLKGRLAGLGVPVEKFAWQLSALHRWGIPPSRFEMSWHIWKVRTPCQHVPSSSRSTMDTRTPTRWLFRCCSAMACRLSSSLWQTLNGGGISGTPMRSMHHCYRPYR